MSELWIPGQKPKGSLTVHVPKGYESDEEARPIGVCTVIVDAEGTLCETPFFPGEERAFQKHTGECAKRHIDFIRAQSPKVKLPAFDEDNWDVEWAAHQKKVGERMLREGRLYTLKNER